MPSDGKSALSMPSECTQIFTVHVYWIYPCNRGNLPLILKEMLFKIQNFFNINGILPLVQGSITSTKYFVANCTGNSSTYTFVTKFLPVDSEVTLYNSVPESFLHNEHVE